MLIIKSKTNLPKEEMKNMYRNLLEQKDLGLIFVNDNYEVLEVPDSILDCAMKIKEHCTYHTCTNCKLADEDCLCRLRNSYPSEWNLKESE